MRQVKRKVGMVLGLIAVVSVFHLVAEEFSLNAIAVVASTWLLVGLLFGAMRHAHKKK